MRILSLRDGFESARMDALFAPKHGHSLLDRIGLWQTNPIKKPNDYRINAFEVCVSTVRCDCGFCALELRQWIAGSSPDAFGLETVSSSDSFS